MRGVSGATGAGEIFAGIVDTLGEREGKVTQKSDANGETTPEKKFFSHEILTITTPLNGTKYLIDTDVPSERQSVTVKYWSQKKYERVNIRLISETAPEKTVLLTDGKLPIGKLSPGTYTVRVEGILPGNTDMASSRFEIE